MKNNPRLIELTTGNTDAHEKIIKLLKTESSEDQPVSFDGLGFAEAFPEQKKELGRYHSTIWNELHACGKGTVSAKGKSHPYTVKVVCRQEQKAINQDIIPKLVDHWVATEIQLTVPALGIDKSVQY